MSNPRENKVRERILRTAERLFAGAGFDGTSVDQIAAGAGVNKAIIYYYFKSKDGLREALFHHVQGDLIAFMDRLLGGFSAAKLRRLSALPPARAIREMPPGYMERFLLDMISFFEEHRDALRLMIMESLKTDSDSPAIFGFFETIFRDQLKKVRARGLPYDAGAKELIYEFFTGFVPLAMFIVLHDQWARHYRTGEEQVKRDFLESFIRSHVLSTERRAPRKGGNRK